MVSASYTLPIFCITVLKTRLNRPQSYPYRALASQSKARTSETISSRSRLSRSRETPKATLRVVELVEDLASQSTTATVCTVMITGWLYQKLSVHWNTLKICRLLLGVSIKSHGDHSATIEEDICAMDLWSGYLDLHIMPWDLLSRGPPQRCLESP